MLSRYMLSRKLPRSLRDLVSLGLGFYAFTAGIAAFCEWHTPQRAAVIAVLLIGMVLAYIASEVFSAIGLLLMKTMLRPPAPK